MFGIFDDWKRRASVSAEYVQTLGKLAVNEAREESERMATLARQRAISAVAGLLALAWLNIALAAWILDSPYRQWAPAAIGGGLLVVALIIWFSSPGNPGHRAFHRTEEAIDEASRTIARRFGPATGPGSQFAGLGGRPEPTTPTPAEPPKPSSSEVANDLSRQLDALRVRFEQIGARPTRRKRGDAGVGRGGDTTRGPDLARGPETSAPRAVSTPASAATGPAAAGSAASSAAPGAAAAAGTTGVGRSAGAAPKAAGAGDDDGDPGTGDPLFRKPPGFEPRSRTMQWIMGLERGDVHAVVRQYGPATVVAAGTALMGPARMSRVGSMLPVLREVWGIASDTAGRKR